MTDWLHEIQGKVVKFLDWYGNLANSDILLMHFQNIAVILTRNIRIFLL